MTDFDHCALCGKRIASIQTRNIGGEFYFCAEDYDNIVYPSVQYFTTQLINQLGGDANHDKRREAAEAFRPTSEFGGQVTRGRVYGLGLAESLERSEGSAQSRNVSDAKGEDREPKGEDKETQSED